MPLTKKRFLPCDSFVRSFFDSRQVIPAVYVPVYTYVCVYVCMSACVYAYVGLYNTFRIHTTNSKVSSRPDFLH